MQKRKKLFLILAILIIALLISSNIVFAAETGGILQKAESAKGKIITLAQDAAKTVAAVFIVWAGYIYWGAGGDQQKITAAKSKLQTFFIALFFIFGAESIVNTIFEIFK